MGSPYRNRGINLLGQQIMTTTPVPADLIIVASEGDNCMGVQARDQSIDELKLLLHFSQPESHR
jgi:hypothetical protein